MSKFNADSRAKTRCYIIRDDDTNPSTNKLVLQFNPTSMPYSRGATFSSIESPGMSYPLTQYVGGQIREFSFEAFYYDKPYSGKIKTARQFLEGLLPPEKNTSSFKKPPTFTLAYGYFVKKYVLTNLSIQDDWLDDDGNPIMTRFTLSVRQVGI